MQMADVRSVGGGISIIHHLNHRYSNILPHKSRSSHTVPYVALATMTYAPHNRKTCILRNFVSLILFHFIVYLLSHRIFV
jgi:hypothetical protein